MPLVHILIPYEFRGKDNPVTFLGWYAGQRWLASYTWENMRGGLDGIAIDLPALKVKPTHGEYFPLNIRIKDPIWPDRDLFDFTFSVKPGEPKTIFMDTRDKVLPNGYSLYLTIAGAGQDFGPAALDGAQVRLIFKDYKESVKEQEQDRFTQVRDTISNLCESGANSRKLRAFEKFDREITDLFRVSPDHELAKVYWNYKNGEQPLPPFTQPEPPAGVPLWAFRQIEDLKLVRHFVNWWIDNRQIENGEFGGGLSDDGDMTHQFVGLAHMGVDTDKITRSIRKLMEAYYTQGMFTNGMITIQTDELHVYEDGLQVLPQDMNLNYGMPRVVERLMETAKAYERVTASIPPDTVTSSPTSTARRKLPMRGYGSGSSRSRTASSIRAWCSWNSTATRVRKSFFWKSPTVSSRTVRRTPTATGPSRHASISPPTRTAGLRAEPRCISSGRRTGGPATRSISNRFMIVAPAVSVWSTAT